MEEKKEVKMKLSTIYVILTVIVALTIGIIIGFLIRNEQIKQKENTNNKFAENNSNVVENVATNTNSNSDETIIAQNSINENTIIQDNSENINNESISENTDNELASFKEDIIKEENRIKNSGEYLLPLFDFTGYSDTRAKEINIEFIGTDKNNLSLITSSYDMQVRAEYRLEDENKAIDNDLILKTTSDRKRLFIANIFEYENSIPESDRKVKPFEVYEIENIDGLIKKVVSYSGHDVYIDYNADVYILMDDGTLKILDWQNALNTGKFIARDIHINSNINIANIYFAWVAGYDASGQSGALGPAGFTLVIEDSNGNFYGTEVIYEK